MSRRSAAGLLAAGLAGSMLPLVGAAAPVVLPSAYAAEDALCSEAVLPDTEAQEVTDGSGVKVAVIDSGIQPGLGINHGGRRRGRNRRASSSPATARSSEVSSPDPMVWPPARR